MLTAIYKAVMHTNGVYVNKYVAISMKRARIDRTLFKKLACTEICQRLQKIQDLSSESVITTLHQTNLVMLKKGRYVTKWRSEPHQNDCI